MKGSVSAQKRGLYEESNILLILFVFGLIEGFECPCFSVCTCISLRPFVDPDLHVVLKFLSIRNHHILCGYPYIFDLKADVTSHTTLYYGGSIVLFTTADW